MKQELTDLQYQRLQSLGYSYGKTLGELIQFLSEAWPSDFNILKYTSGWQVGTGAHGEWEMKLVWREYHTQKELIELLYEAAEYVLTGVDNTSVEARKRRP